MTIRQLTAADVAPAAQVLAEAFSLDPLYGWLLPGAADRVDELERLFHSEIRHAYLEKGTAEVAVTDAGEVAGVTLWSPPGQWEFSLGTTLRMLPTKISVLRSRIPAGIQFEKLFAQRHPNQPHWYLSAIATSPAARGTGYGTKLLLSRLDRCDADGVPAYLESSALKNVPYYERFGFTRRDEFSMPDGPPIVTMWREPQTPRP